MAFHFPLDSPRLVRIESWTVSPASTTSALGIASLPQLLSTTRAAQLFDVSRVTLWRWRRLGKVRCVVLPSGRERILTASLVTVARPRRTHNRTRTRRSA